MRSVCPQSFHVITLASKPFDKDTLDWKLICEDIMLHHLPLEEDGFLWITQSGFKVDGCKQLGGIY